MQLESKLRTIEYRLSKHVQPNASILHGINHWREVSLLAGEIANDSGADITSAVVAGFLHDVGRKNDFFDPEHGRRSATIARPLIERYFPQIDADAVCYAIALHADGMVTDEPIAACLWDADRLSLRRLGAAVRVDMLSTQAAKRILREHNDRCS